MEAFFNKQSIKDKYINRVKMHIEADNLIRGAGWNGAKGCAVGCTLENYEHGQYKTELGLPEWLAHLEDKLFEGMSLEKSKTWPLVFLQSIPIGVDCNKAKTPFLIKVLERNLRSIDACKLDRAAYPDVVEAIKKSKEAVLQMIDAQKSRGKQKMVAAEFVAWSASESAARYAAWPTTEFVASVARSAASAEHASESVAWSAASVARSVAWSAASPKYASESVAWSAEYAARSAASSWSAAFNEIADELIQILKELK